MSSKYYYLVAGLPELTLEDSQPISAGMQVRLSQAFPFQNIILSSTMQNFRLSYWKR